MIQCFMFKQCIRNNIHFVFIIVDDFCCLSMRCFDDFTYLLVNFKCDLTRMCIT